MAYPIPEPQYTPGKAFERLISILDTLRIACPWDRKQTMDSLRLLTIEELYELTDAILEKDYQEIKKELGDVMLHLLFYAKMADEQQQLNVVDDLDHICDNLVVRLSHIYADPPVGNEEDVQHNWASIKLTAGNQSVLSGGPKALPALVKAYRIQ